MSISLPTKQNKKIRYRMLVKQGSLTQQQANKAYRDYLQLFNKVRQTETKRIIAQVSN